MSRFEDLDVYQDSLDYSSAIYNLTKGWSREYLYDLTSQIRRAFLSIPLNIAEGSARSPKDFGRFLDIAKGSCFECIPLIELAFRQDLLKEKDSGEWKEKLEVLSKRILALKNSLKS
jgi:four helix bundle protein